MLLRILAQVKKVQQQLKTCMKRHHDSPNPSSKRHKIPVLYKFEAKNMIHQAFILFMVFLVTPICAQNPYHESSNILLRETFDQGQSAAKTPQILLLATKSFYSGTFFSTIPQPTLDSITVKQGDATLKFFIANQNQAINQLSKSPYFTPSDTLTANNILKPQDTSSYKNLAQVGAPDQNYEAWFRFYNPRYVSEEVLHCKIQINSSIFKNELDGSIGHLGREQEDLYKNITQQTCVVGNNSWSCKNTLLNYTTTWRDWDNDTTSTIYVDYTMTVTYGDSSNAQTIQFEFQIQNARSLSLQQIKPVFFGLSSKTPLVYESDLLEMLTFILFALVIVGFQNLCARLMKIKLIALGNGQKQSLVTISFCVICDLLNGINFAFNAYQTQNVLYRIGFIALTAAYIALYVVFDIFILNKVIIGHIQERNLPMQDLMKFIKKAFIAFFLVFLLAYEAVVFMTSFFGFEWWHPILMTVFIIPPQIIRNFRKGFGGDGIYIPYIGFLASRYLMFIYQKSCPSNVYGMKPYPGVGLTIFILLVVEVVILGCQNRYGSRFFIPVKWRPGYFNYLYKGSLESINDRDCTVCLQDIAKDSQQAQISSNNENIDHNSSIITEEEDQGNLREALTRKTKVFRTPCDHFFHPSCLKSWMAVKLECPTCRTPLPAL